MTNGEGLTMYTQEEMEQTIKDTGNNKFWFGVLAGVIVAHLIWGFVLFVGIYLKV